MKQKETPSKRKSLKERRLESDEKIIRSAIRCFGKNGYTHTSIVEIAKGAGVTGGLITQRYSTKENLFYTAYVEALKGLFSDPGTDSSPRECLYMIVKDIIRISRNNPDEFDFCLMLHNSTDYPKECLSEIQASMKDSNCYRILARAQQEGMLPEGNLDYLLSSMGANVFNNVHLCHKYNQALPDTDIYLDAIHFVDEQVLKRRRWNRILQIAISNTFEILIYINIAENRGEMIKASESFGINGNSDDISHEIELAVDKHFRAEDKASVRDFLNLETLGKRLENRKSISLRQKKVDGTTWVGSFIPISWDENGKLTEVFAGLYESKTDREKEEQK